MTTLSDESNEKLHQALAPTIDAISRAYYLGSVDINQYQTALKLITEIADENMLMNVWLKHDPKSVLQAADIYSEEEQEAYRKFLT